MTVMAFHLYSLCGMLIENVYLHLYPEVEGEQASEERHCPWWPIDD
jgi:hypothetical protein